MRLDITNIVKTEGAVLDVELEERLEDISKSREEVAFDQPVSFKGRLRNVKGVLKLDGRVSAGYKSRCYRCLKEITGFVEVAVQEEFIESALAGDSPESYTHDGHFIDMDQVLRDSLVLHLPMRILCKEGCKGLCPVCGADLNERVCGCEMRDPDLRMEPLLKFYEKMNKKQ